MARAPASFHAAIDRHWHGVSRNFRTDGLIVDLACGTGPAGKRVKLARPDLEVIGIDFADIAARRDRDSIDVRPRVAIEQLPFADSSVDGAISQFGFEYCHVERGVAEVARVLRRGAPLNLVVHHGHSPILVDNVRSDRALRQLLSPPMKRAFVSGDRPMAHAIIVALPTSLRLDPTIQLLTAALIERLAWPADKRARAWDAIAEAMRPEIALAAALDRSAVSPAHMNTWLAPFAGRFDGIKARPFDVAGLTMAWTVSARRSG